MISERTLQMSIIISVILQLELNCWQKQGYTPCACRV